MPEELAAKPQSNEGDAQEAGSSVNMELETSSSTIPGGSEPQVAGNGTETPAEDGAGGVVKRKREKGGDAAAVEEEEEYGTSKKQMVERSPGEERLEKMEETKEGGEDSKAEEKEVEGGGGEEKKSLTVSLGPKEFASSKEMFYYFLDLLRRWSPNLDINKYEHMVLLDLLQKGHPEPERTIGEGIQAFQVRCHPAWKSRSFFIVRVDGTDDDFSFSKCIDQILPLPDHMKSQSASKKGGRSRGKSWRGRGGRGGK